MKVYKAVTNNSLDWAAGKEYVSIEVALKDPTLEDKQELRDWADKHNMDVDTKPGSFAFDVKDGRWFSTEKFKLSTFDPRMLVLAKLRWGGALTD